MSASLVESLKTLPAHERLELISTLWDSLDDAVVPVTDAQLAELRRRRGAMTGNVERLATPHDVREESGPY